MTGVLYLYLQLFMFFIIESELSKSLEPFTDSVTPTVEEMSMTDGQMLVCSVSIHVVCFVTDPYN